LDLKYELKTFLKFILVGVSNTLLNFLVFFITFRLLNIFYILSSVISFIFAFTNSYFWNKTWTFKKISNQYQLPKFFIVNILSLLINVIILFLAVEILNIHPLIGQIFGISSSLSINFLGNRYWVFNN
jgi:putative flippase GtrA